MEVKTVLLCGVASPPLRRPRADLSRLSTRGPNLAEKSPTCQPVDITSGGRSLTRGTGGGGALRRVSPMVETAGGLSGRSGAILCGKGFTSRSSREPPPLGTGTIMTWLLSFALLHRRRMIGARVYATAARSEFDRHWGRGPADLTGRSLLAPGAGGAPHLWI